MNKKNAEHGLFVPFLQRLKNNPFQFLLLDQSVFQGLSGILPSTVRVAFASTDPAEFCAVQL